MKSIETIKELKNIGNALTTEEKSGKPLKIVSGEPFCLDKVIVDKKDIFPYIKGKATPLLGDDFYYCYKYENGVLAFVAFVSSSYQVGAVHFLVKAILNQGKYYARMPAGNVFYYIVNDAPGINVEVDYEQRDGYELLDAHTVHADLMAEVKKNPGIRAKWALEKSALNINLLLIVVFAVLMGVSLLASWKYKAAKASFEATRARVVKPVVHDNKNFKLPNAVSVITRVGDMVYGKGIIEKAEVKGKTMDFVILFNSETAAQSFIREFGGKYEQGKVIYSTPFSPAR